jgi:hypothetical protein
MKIEKYTYFSYGWLFTSFTAFVRAFKNPSLHGETKINHEYPTPSWSNDEKGFTFDFFGKRRFQQKVVHFWFGLPTGAREE